MAHERLLTDDIQIVRLTDDQAQTQTNSFAQTVYPEYTDRRVLLP